MWFKAAAAADTFGSVTERKAEDDRSIDGGPPCIDSTEEGPIAITVLDRVRALIGRPEEGGAVLASA